MRFVQRKFEWVRLIIFRIRDLGVAGSNPVPGTTRSMIIIHPPATTRKIEEAQRWEFMQFAATIKGRSKKEPDDN